MIIYLRTIINRPSESLSHFVTAPFDKGASDLPKIASLVKGRGTACGGGIRTTISKPLLFNFLYSLFSRRSRLLQSPTPPLAVGKLHFATCCNSSLRRQAFFILALRVLHIGSADASYAVRRASFFILRPAHISFCIFCQNIQIKILNLYKLTIEKFAQIVIIIMYINGIIALC